jgi:hypothetical protein
MRYKKNDGRGSCRKSGRGSGIEDRAGQFCGYDRDCKHRKSVAECQRRAHSDDAPDRRPHELIPSEHLGGAQIILDDHDRSNRAPEALG